ARDSDVRGPGSRPGRALRQAPRRARQDRSQRRRRRAAAHGEPDAGRLRRHGLRELGAPCGVRAREHAVTVGALTPARLTLVGVARVARVGLRTLPLLSASYALRLDG